MDADHELYVPLSALNAYLFCPHRMYREYVLGEWADNIHTVDAGLKHRRAHAETSRVDEEGRQWTRVWVKSEEHRLSGIVDVVEEPNAEGGAGDAGVDGSEAGDAGGRARGVEAAVYPVEYKRGRRGNWLNDHVQLCAQAICLEEQLGRAVPRGFLWYFGSRAREPVEFTPELRQRTLAVARECLAVLEGSTVPPAVYHEAKCGGCSLQPLCLPRETQILRELTAAHSVGAVRPEEGGTAS